MRKLSKESRRKVDQRLAEIEAKVLADTTFDWESIRPELTDQAEYDRLMEIVNESTQRNESIGQFMDRLKALGSSGESLLKKVQSFMLG